MRARDSADAAPVLLSCANCKSVLSVFRALEFIHGVPCVQCLQTVHINHQHIQCLFINNLHVRGMRSALGTAILSERAHTRVRQDDMVPKPSASSVQCEMSFSVTLTTTTMMLFAQRVQMG